MRLLVVEDDNTIRDFLTRALTESGFGVDACSQGSEAERLALEGVHDALVVDLNLPDGDGLDLIQRLRSQGVSSPVLILSARRSVDERVLGLERGGDDYMTKPFAVAELQARLRALLRRKPPASASPISKSTSSAAKRAAPASSSSSPSRSLPCSNTFAATLAGSLPALWSSIMSGRCASTPPPTSSMSTSTACATRSTAIRSVRSSVPSAA